MQNLLLLLLIKKIAIVSLFLMDIITIKIDPSWYIKTTVLQTLTHGHTITTLKPSVTGLFPIKICLKCVQATVNPA